MILYDYLKDRIREIMNKDVENPEVLRTTFFFVAFQHTLGWKSNDILQNMLKHVSSTFSDFISLFAYIYIYIFFE